MVAIRRMFSVQRMSLTISFWVMSNKTKRQPANKPQQEFLFKTVGLQELVASSFARDFVPCSHHLPFQDSLQCSQSLLKYLFTDKSPKILKLSHFDLLLSHIPCKQGQLGLGGGSGRRESKDAIQHHSFSLPHQNMVGVSGHSLPCNFPCYYCESFPSSWFDRIMFTPRLPSPECGQPPVLYFYRLKSHRSAPAAKPQASVTQRSL